MTRSVVFVAAVAENGVIGRGGAMPWRLKSDMRHFRALTMGKPVVMGRKTYLSLGQAAAGPHQHRGDARPGFAAPGVLVAPSLEAALEAARGDALRRGGRAIMVIGGAEIYAQAMPRGRPAGDHADPRAARGRHALPADRSARLAEVARSEHRPGRTTTRLTIS